MSASLITEGISTESSARVAAADPVGPDALEAFLATCGPAHRVQIAVPTRTCLTLWAIAVAGAGAVALGWLGLGSNDCRTGLCSVATWGGQLRLTVGIAAAGTAALLLVATVTRGLTRANAWQASGMAGGATAVVGSLLAAAAVIVLLMVTALVALVGAVVLIARTSGGRT